MILVMMGQDANLLSIGAVDFGIIVDSAVILVENMFRIFEAPRDQQDIWLEQLSEGRWGRDPTSERGVGTVGAMQRKWSRRLRMIFMSAIQIDNSIMFSTLITVAAFIPLFTMTGVEGQIFGPMARTYAFALAGALLATFTVTPVIASFLLPKHVEEVETFLVRWLRRTYTPMLDFALERRKLTVGIGVVFLLITGFLFTRLGGEFLPALEEGNFWIRASLPPTMTLKDGTEATRKIRDILMRYPEVVTVVSQHGRPDNGTDASPFSNIELFVPLKPHDQWPAGVTKESLTSEVNKAFKRELPGVNFNFSQYIQDNIQEAISGVKGANSVKIVGPNLNVDEDLAQQIQTQMSKVRGVADLGIFHVVGQPNLNIRIDREKTARYGLNTGDVNTVIQAAMGGAVATTVLEADRQWNVTVRAQEDQRDSIEKIGDIKVGYQTPAGTTAYIPLRELATISVDTGASYIYHETTKRYLPVKFSVRGRDLAGAVAEAQDRIARNVHLPNGYRLIWAGEFQDMKEAQARLAVVVPVSLLLIVILLYSLFNSVGDAFLALSGIPFAVGGGILALYIAGLPLSVSGEIGFISLFGVSVMNGILLITYYNQTRAGGLDPYEAMKHAAEQRMRPLMMTALSACIGLLPAALSSGIGSQVQKPLAVVVVGGMLLSPVLLLVVVPAFRLLVAGAEGKKEPSLADVDDDDPALEI